MDDNAVLDTAMAAALTRSAELNDRFPEPRNLEEERQRDQAFAPAWAAGAPEVASVEPYSVPTECGHRSALLVRPPNVERPPLIVLIHGGGWNKGSIAQTAWQQNTLCVASGHAVLSVSYRLAPEHPFPAGLHDVEAAYEWGQTNPPLAGRRRGPIWRWRQPCCGVSGAGRYLLTYCFSMASLEVISTQLHTARLGMAASDCPGREWTPASTTMWAPAATAMIRWCRP